MARGSSKSPAHALAPALRALGSEHRQAVARSIGAATASAEAIGAVLCDEQALAAIVAGLDTGARRLVTQTAFAPSNTYSNGRGEIDPDAVRTLERHGLLLSFEQRWGRTVVAPLELEPSLRRIRARAHAALAPDGDPGDARVVHVPEQLLHDAALIASVIGRGGIQLKADGDLFARAVPKLAGALAPLAVATAGLDTVRMDLALRLLEENGALRVRGLGLPGATSKRELALALDVPSLLAVPFAARVALMDAIGHSPRLGSEIIEMLLDAFAGRTVALGDVGASMRRLCGEAAKEIPEPGGSASDEQLGLWMVTERWLRGDVGLTVDAVGTPVLAVMTAVEGEDPAGLPCVAQSDFELVMMRPVTPGERAAVLSVAEPVAGREHVARVTKERVWDAVRGATTTDVVGRLRALAGTLPQNVEQTVQGWERQAPRRARLRSAMILAAPDEPTAERLAFALGPALRERLSPTLLAVDAGALSAVAKAVRQTGVELDDGVDRVSGTWVDRPDRDAHPQWWHPTPDGGRPAPAAPAGRLVSGLGSEPESEPERGALAGVDGDDDHRHAADELARLLAQAGLERDTIELILGGDDDEDLEDHETALEDILLLAHETDAIVRITYAGANGFLKEWVTIVQLDDARVRVCDNATGKRSWRWLRSIAEAEIIR